MANQDEADQGRDKPLLRVLRGEILERPPFWLMRQAGRYLPEYLEVRRQAGDFLTLCYSPDLAVEVTLQPLRRFAMDAAILFADILVVPDALGQPLNYREGEGPVLDPVRSAAELSRLDMAGLHDRLAPVYETIRRLRRELPPSTALIGFAGAPWTVATYMVEGGGSRDFATIKAWAYGDPDGFSELIALLVDATTEYLEAQAEAGAEVVQLFDTWAGALPESAFGRWCVEPVAEIVRRFRKSHPEVPVIAFPRGAGVLYAGYAQATGVAGLGLDATVPLRWAAETLQTGATLQGNLDPLMLVTGGEPMRREMGRILETLGSGPFIFNLGHGIIPATPPEHVAELADFVRSWRA
ncbi:MAG TPA: uroporphyrinogen decarboxylase [Alphaproteobacteria bacterium]|nr:uroporphyrinogen decarboxylase [Alphaproteobacteria bacterium]